MDSKLITYPVLSLLHIQNERLINTQSDDFIFVHVKLVKIEVKLFMFFKLVKLLKLVNQRKMMKWVKLVK